MNKAFILLQLKTKYSKLGLSEKALSALADKILSDLGADATPADVQTAVDGVEPYVKLMQSEADTARTLARKETKPATDKGNEGNPGGDSEPEGKSDDANVPTWAKPLFTEISSLKAENAALKQEGANKSRRQAYEQELAGLPDDVRTQHLEDFDLLNFKDADHFTSWLDGKKTKIAALKEANDVQNASNFGRTQRPAGTNGTEKPSSQFESFKATKEAQMKDVQAKSPFQTTP